MDLTLTSRCGATLFPVPYDWDLSFEALPVGDLVSARWHARPTAGELQHREGGAAVYREDGWATRLHLTATTLGPDELIERSLDVTMLVGAAR